MTALENIDIKPQNSNIELEEITDFFDGKNKSFPANEKNIQAINKELQSTEKTSLTISLENCLTEAFEDIIIKETLSPTDIQILTLWNTLLGENDQQKREQLQDLMSEKVSLFMDGVGLYDFSKMEEEEKKSFYNMVMLSKWEEDDIDKKEYKNVDMDLFFVQSMYAERENTKSKNIQENITNDVTLITKDYVTDPDQVPLLVGGQYKFTPSEIAVIQFLAKTQGEDIQINWERARVNVRVQDEIWKQVYVKVPTLDIELYKQNNQNTFDEKSRTTNVWIYREELKWLFAEEKDTWTKNLSTYFETELEKITDQDIKNKVLAKFGEDTKRIRTFWQSYSKNEKDALKYYFSLLVDIELETDATKKQTLITEANTKITSIQNNVQEFVTKDKGYVLNSYKQKIKIQENKDELTWIVTQDVQGFVEWTTKEDIEKMLAFVNASWSANYIGSIYPDFQDHLYKAIIEEYNSSKAPSFSRSNKGGELFKDSLVDAEFIKNLWEKDQNFKKFFIEQSVLRDERIENKEYEERVRKVQTIADISTQFLNFLKISCPNYPEYQWYFEQGEASIDRIKNMDLKADYLKPEVIAEYGGFGLDRYLENHIKKIFFATESKWQLVENVIFKLLCQDTYFEKLWWIEYGKEMVDEWTQKISRILLWTWLQDGEGKFENRWTSEEKTNEVWAEMSSIFQNWDENNELLFSKSTYWWMYVEANSSSVLDNMKEEDKNAYPSLSAWVKQIDAVVVEMINEEGMLDGTSELAWYLKEYNDLLDSQKKIEKKPDMVKYINDELLKRSGLIAWYFSKKWIAVDWMNIWSLAQNYILLQQQYKNMAVDIEKQKEEMKTWALEKIKIEQERIKTKREWFNEPYATEESKEQRDLELWNAQLVLEVINNWQATTIEADWSEKITTIADLINNERIDASIKLQQTMALWSILKWELTKAFIRGEQFKKDLIEIEKKPESQRNSFEKQMYIMNDSLGWWSRKNFSDENQNTWSQVAETVIVQAILIAVSWWIWSIAEAGLVNILAKIPGVARSLATVAVMSKAGAGFMDVWRFSKIAAITSKWIWVMWTTANWIVFHIGNTIGNGLYAWQSLDTIIKSLDPSPKQKIGPNGEPKLDENWDPVMTIFGEEYLHSIWFITVMHLFGPITAKLNLRFDTASKASMWQTIPLSRWTKAGNIFKAELSSLPPEIASMLATEKTLEFLFNEGEVSAITWESFLNTLVLIVWLRWAHRYLPPFHQIKAKIDQKTFEAWATKISDVDINKVISSMKDSPSSVFVNSKADKVDKTSFENDGKSWSFAIKGKWWEIVFYDRNWRAVLGVSVESKGENIKQNVKSTEDVKSESIINGEWILDTNKDGVFDNKNVETLSASTITSELVWLNILEIAKVGKIEWAEKSIVDQIMSLTSDTERLVVAEFLLNRKLTEEEKTLIIEAHETNGNEQTLLKLRKLFSIDEMTVLTRRGVCGTLVDKIVNKFNFNNLFQKNNLYDKENINDSNNTKFEVDRNWIKYWHWTNSSALIWLVRDGGLVPTWDLIAEGRAPFSGELWFWIMDNWINNKNISVWYTWSYKDRIGMGSDVDYANENFNKSSFNIKQTYEKIKNLEKAINETTDKIYVNYYNRKIEILENRIKIYKGLSSIEKEFVDSPFPVAIKLDPLFVSKQEKSMVKSDVVEIALKWKIDNKNITYIYVPKDKISIVNKYMKANNLNIDVLPIESIWNRFYEKNGNNIVTDMDKELFLSEFSNNDYWHEEKSWRLDDKWTFHYNVNYLKQLWIDCKITDSTLWWGTSTTLFGLKGSDWSTKYVSLKEHPDVEKIIFVLKYAKKDVLNWVSKLERDQFYFVLYGDLTIEKLNSKSNREIVDIIGVLWIQSDFDLILSQFENEFKSKYWIEDLFRMDENLLEKYIEWKNNEFFPRIKELIINEIDSIKYSIVKANAALKEWPRLQKAEELLPSRKQTLVDGNGKPTVLWEKVLNAHDNSKGGEIYKITPEQLTEKVRILKDAGFASDEIRILIENGICGKVEAEFLDVDKNGVFDGSDVEVLLSNAQIEINKNDVKIDLETRLNVEGLETKDRSVSQIARLDKTIVENAIKDGKMKLLIENWVGIHSYDIEDIAKLEITTIENAAKDKKITLLMENWFKVDVDNIKNIARLDKTIVENAIKDGKMKLLIENWMRITTYDIENIARLDKTIVENAIKDNKIKLLQDKRVNVNIGNLEWIAKLTADDIVNSQNKINFLQEKWFRVDAADLYSLITLTLDDVKVIATLKDKWWIDEDGLYITGKLYALWGKEKFSKICNLPDADKLWFEIILSYNYFPDMDLASINNLSEWNAMIVNEMTLAEKEVVDAYLKRSGQERYRKSGKRYLLSEDPIVKENLKKLQKTIKDIQITYSEVVWLNMFGSYTKWYARPWSSDIDWYIYLDADQIAKTHQEFISIDNQTNNKNIDKEVLSNYYDNLLGEEILKKVWVPEVHLFYIPISKEILDQQITYYVENNKLEPGKWFLLEWLFALNVWGNPKMIEYREYLLNRMSELWETWKKMRKDMNFSLRNFANLNTDIDYAYKTYGKKNDWSASREKGSTVDPEIVKTNAALDKWPRLQKAEELLPSRKQTLVDGNGKPTVLWEKVLNAHNNSKWGEIYKITPEQLTEKVRILKDAGFTSDEIRILIENGICGKVEAEVLDLNKDGVFDGSDVEMMISWEKIIEQFMEKIEFDSNLDKDMSNPEKRAMIKAKEMWSDFAVALIKKDYPFETTTEPFIVNKNFSSEKPVELRFQDGSYEYWRRKNGKLEWEGNRSENSNERYWVEERHWIEEFWKFENGKLKDGEREFGSLTSEKTWIVSENGKFEDGNLVDWFIIQNNGKRVDVKIDTMFDNKKEWVEIIDGKVSKSEKEKRNTISQLDYIKEIKKGDVLQPEILWENIDTKTENLRDLAIQNKDFFLNTIQEFASKSKSKIEGEKYIVKELDRMQEKVYKEYEWKVENVEQLVDVLRTTLVFETVEDINSNFQSFVDFLAEKNIEVVKVKNRLWKLTMWDVLINVKLPDWTIAEIKLYTQVMLDAQDTLRVLPADTKIPVMHVVDGENQLKVYEYGNLWTEREMKYIQELKDEWRIKHTVDNDINAPIKNHTFYEIDRILSDINEIEIRKIYKEKGVEIKLLKNKLIAIQEANSHYSMELYEKEYKRSYIPK